MTIITWDTVNKGSGVVLSNGNLTANVPSLSNTARATIGKVAGKWYWEIKADVAGFMMIGIVNKLAPLTSQNYNTANAKYYYQNGEKVSSVRGAYGASYTTGDTISVLLDLSIGTIEFWKNGVSQGVAYGDILAMGEVLPAITSGTTSGDTLKATANFGETPFKYPVPNGYKPYQSADNKSFILFGDGYKKYQVKDEPIHQFDFDEPSGNVIDSKGAAVGTVAGATRVIGWNGQGYALSFNGTSNYVTFNSRVVPIGKKSIRFKIKIPTSHSSVQMILENSRGSDTHGDAISLLASGNIQYISSKGTSGSPRIQIVSNKSIADNQWHDVLLTWDGTTNSDGVKLYVDNMDIPDVKGTSLASETILQSYDMRLGTNSVGQTPPTFNFFNGQLDNLEIYNEVYNPSIALLGWKTVSFTLPTLAQFQSEGMDDLSIFDRKVQAVLDSPQAMTSSVLGAGKVFKGSVDLSKYFDLRKLEVK